MRENKLKILRFLGTLIIGVSFIIPSFMVQTSARGNNYAIDIYNGDEISVKAYDRIARDGTSVIIKATEGTTGTDSYARYRGKICQEKGIDFSFYHMLCASSSPETQARHFYDVTKDYNNTMLNALDIEYNTVRPVAENYANRFIAEYKRLSGQDLMIYSCESYLHECFSRDFLNSHYLWVANYSRKPNVPNLVIHQFKEGKDPSHNYGGDGRGNIDQNEIYMPNILYRSGNTNYQLPSYNHAEQEQSQVMGKVAELQEILGNVAIDNIYGKQTEGSFRSQIGIINNSNPEMVKWLQRRLFSNPNEWDGCIGNKTIREIKKFQKSHHIKADGKVGIITLRILCTC